MLCLNCAQWAQTQLLTSVEAVATLAFALSGLLEAARKRLDVVGVWVVTFLAAFGGGTLRDILLDKRPFFWVQHTPWLWVLLGLCLLAMHFMRTHHLHVTQAAILWPDALGLGLFTASGAQLALQQGMGGLVAVLMGVITAVFGGVLRDIVCNQIPHVFRDHRPYAVCAFIGGWLVVLAQTLGWPQWAGLLAATTAVSGLRALALLTDFRLPVWNLDEPSA